MADNAIVGALKTLLTMDSSSYESGAKKAVQTDQALRNGFKQTGEEIKKITPLAERMVKSLGGDKLIYTANSLTAAVTKLGGASKLTEAEQARVNKTLDAAITKYQKLGQTAPQAMLDLEKATRKTGEGTNFLTTKMVALGAAAGTFAAALAGQAIRGVINMGRDALNTASNIVDLSNSTGLSMKTIQQMQFVAEQTGTSLDSLTNAAFKLGVNIQKGGTEVDAALRELERYGLQVEKLKNARPDEMWNMVAAALEHVDNVQERNRLGMALMGKTFSDVAKAIGDGYTRNAAQARTATDAQIRELERLGDEWDKFKRNLTMGFTAAMGSIVLRSRITADLIREQVAKGKFAGENTRDFQAEIERRMVLGLADARTKDIELTKEAAQAQADYVKQLADVRAKIAALNPEARKQIDAARELGGDALKDVAERYHLTEQEITLYSNDLRDATKATKDAKKSQDELNAANMRWLDILGMIEIAEMKRNRSQLAIVGDLNATGLDEMFNRLEGMSRGTSALTIFGDLIPQAESLDALLDQMKQDLDAFDAPANRARQALMEVFAPLVGGAIRGVGNMLFGGSDAQEAKRHFEDFKKSGKATAEELTRAFEAWRHSENRAWDAFTNAPKNMLNRFLDYWVNSFLGGLIKSIVGTSLGQRFGGLLASSLGIGGSIAAGAGTAVAATTAAAGTSALTVGSGVVAGLNAQVGATAAAAGAGGSGLGATLAGLATNPITIGAAVAIAGGLLLKTLGFFDSGPGDLSRSIRARMLTRQGVPQSQWPDWVREDTSTMARFTAPDISMPSSVNVLNGSGLVSQTPFAQTEASHRFGRTVHVNVNVSTIDAKGVRDFVRSREFGNAIAFSYEQNDQQRTSRTRRAFNP